MRSGWVCVIAVGISSLIGCSGGPTASDGSTAGTANDDAQRGGSDAGGSQSEAGGASSGGGGRTSGGASAGSAGSAGQNTAGGSVGCRDSKDCPDRGAQLGYIGAPQCLPPGEPTPAICGAPGWCGHCNCPLTSGSCMSDDECSEQAPHCLLRNGTGGCVTCRSTADCATGACEAGACVTKCGPSDPCSDPFVACSEARRCESPVACGANGACPENGACEANVCVRRPCDADEQCDGACVLGRCYSRAGSCFQHIAVP